MRISSGSTVLIHHHHHQRLCIFKPHSARHMLFVIIIIIIIITRDRPAGRPPTCLGSGGEILKNVENWMQDTQNCSASNGASKIPCSGVIAPAACPQIP